MDRTNEHSLYNFTHSLLQYGGYDTSKIETYEEINKYTPSDIDDETATAVDKFRKANRLLAKKLEDITDALDKEKSKNAKLQKQVKIKQFHQG
jgi:predicted transcriptional regulator